MTLIGRMHSLRHGEGRGGYCRTARACIDFKTKWPLKAMEMKAMPEGQSSLWEGLGWSGWQVGRHHPNSPYWPHFLCFTTVQWRPATRNQKGKRSKEKPERQTQTERKRGDGGKEGEMEDYGINSVVKKKKKKSNPTTVTTTKPKSLEKMFSFANTSWYCLYRGRSTREWRFGKVKDSIFEMEFAYSCGLTEYSMAWLESWILRSWTVGKGKGSLEDCG